LQNEKKKYKLYVLSKLFARFNHESLVSGTNEPIFPQKTKKT
jgi:hypothetical protein